MTFDPGHPLLIACRQLGAAFDLRDAEIAATLGISRNELRLLNLLEDGPRSQVDVATHLFVSRAAVTSMVDSLEARGLVERSPSEGDRRVKLVSLTPKVWRVLAEHYGPGGRRVLEATAALDQGELDRLVDLLTQVSNAIRMTGAQTPAR